jgi:hypothetical protein
LVNRLALVISAFHHGGLDLRRGPVTDIKKGARLTGDDRARMAERVTAQYNQGRSIREIAQDTGRSYGFVHRVLSESEVALRGRGGPTRRKRD